MNPAPPNTGRRFPFLGHGIGLRTVHYPELLARVAAGAPLGVDWFEIISENFFRPGGNPRRVLRTLRDRVPLVMHGVSLSLGAVDPLHAGYLDELSALARELTPPLVSDHLCWSGHGGSFAHDLLPLPYTEEALAHVAARVSRVQDRLGRRILVENVSSYLTFTHSTLTEWEFLAALAERADCGLLLDVNNVFVSAHNHGFDARAFIDGLPADRVAQLHLAGHSTREALLLDTHDHAVRDEVWDLYRHTLTRTGPVSTLIEWDDKIPPLAVVLAESHKAAAIARAAAAGVGARAADQPAPTGATSPALADTEARLYELITAKQTVPEALRARGLPPEHVTAFVHGDAKMSAMARVDIYNGMYFLRLLDMVREDFPITEAALGAEVFRDLCADFLAALPPSKPTARDTGERWPEFLAARPPAAQPAWLPDLARLEWAIADVFDDPDAPLLDGGQLAGITPERLVALPLRFVPAHRLLRCTFAADDLWRDLEAHRSATPAPRTVLVWRQDQAAATGPPVSRIRNRALPDAEAGVVDQLVDGTTFGALCEHLGEGRDEAAAAALAIECLGRWIGDGLLRAAPAG